MSKGTKVGRYVVWVTNLEAATVIIAGYWEAAEGGEAGHAGWGQIVKTETVPKSGNSVRSGAVACVE